MNWANLGGLKMKKNMKTMLAGILLAIAAGTAIAEPRSPQMTTIEAYIKQNDLEKNPGAAEHVFLRCSTLMKFIGFQMMRSGDDAIGKRFVEASDRYSDLLLKNPDFNLQWSLDQTKRMLAA